MEKFCVSCYTKIEENSYSCKCGHVHEADRKLINGKRYSVYREQLYFKLTLQELEQTDKKRPQQPRKRKLSDNTQVQKKSLKKRRRKTSKNAKRQKYQYGGGELRHAYGTTFSAVDHSEKNSENFYPTRWNFEFALEDINRRILKQSLFWIRV